MSRYIDKVCPVILRGPSQTSEILAFQHPSAGIQIVKGTLEPGERPEEGVVRELAEESGIEDAVVVESIGELDLDSVGHHWFVFLCESPRPLADSWSFSTLDAGGLNLEFFWYPLNQLPGASWHESFKLALAFIRNWNKAREI